MKKKMKKKVAKKRPVKKTRPPGRVTSTPVSEAQLRAEVAEVRASLLVDDGEGGTVPVLCGQPGCFAAAVDWIDDAPYCEEHIPAEAVAVADYLPAGALTAEDVAEILASEQAPSEPYVPPPLADPPVLPDLSGHVLEFHTPPWRRGLLCDVAFALFPDDCVVIRRVHDRLDGGATYSLAAAGDLDDEQSGEITSRAWYPVTDEEHERLASCDTDEPPAASERLSA